VVQVRFLDADGNVIEGQGAAKVDINNGTVLDKITPTSATQGVYDVVAVPGEKLTFLVEHSLSVVGYFEMEVPAVITGIVDMQLTPTPNGPGQPNDLCANAIPVAVPSVTGGSTVGATTDVGTPACGTATISSPGVWYSFIGDGLTTTVSVCNAANFDTKLSVFCLGCDVQTCVGGFDDSPGCAGFTSSVTADTDVGAEYLVLVHGFGGQTGFFNLSVSTGGAPTQAAVNCVATGACCNCGAVAVNCQEATETNCGNLGGDYLGDNTFCIAAGNSPAVYGPSSPGSLIASAADGNPGGLTEDTITIPISFVVADVNLEISIDHTFIGDLTLTLSHGAQSSEMWSEVCGSTDNINVTFDDDGTTTLCAEINAGPSNLIILDPDLSGAGSGFELFQGADAFGDWDLTIVDGFGLDNGTLNTWSLIIDAGVPQCPDQNDGSCFLCPIGGGDDDDDHVHAHDDTGHLHAHDDHQAFQTTFRGADQGPRTGGVDVRSQIRAGDSE
jgi:subtilisin-like proprotein convertase family protein